MCTNTTPMKRPSPGHIGFQTYTREDGDTGVRLVSANNEVLMSSEGYKDPRDAEHLMELLREKVADAEYLPQD